MSAIYKREHFDTGNDIVLEAALDFRLASISFGYIERRDNKRWVSDYISKDPWTLFPSKNWILRRYLFNRFASQFPP